MRSLLVSLAAAAACLAADQRLDRIPLYFEQQAPDIFTAQAPGSLLTINRASVETRSIRLDLDSPAPGSALVGESPMAASVTHFVGNERTQNPVFERVRYRNVRPGIDLLFYGHNGRLEYDLILAPGADPKSIRFRLNDGSAAQVNAAGDLLIRNGAAQVEWLRPVIYEQETGKPVAGSFVVRNREIRFSVASYNQTQSLVIDPVLKYVTYLGSTGNEIGHVITDDQGNFYLAGSSTSQDLPVTPGSFQPAFGGRTANLITGDAFVAKFNASGSLAWLTYLGGRGDDFATGVAVDSGGNVLVTGFTNSMNFPLKNAAQSAYGGQSSTNFVPFGDAFLAKLNPSGSQLIYSTYFGGRQDDCANAIVTDLQGNAYIGGFTLSRDFPTTMGVYQPAFKGSGGQSVFPKLGTPWVTEGDGFIAKFNPSGQVMFSTYFGGSSDDAIVALALDSSQNIYIGGMTLSYDLPVSSNAPKKTFSGNEFQNEFGNFGDGFVAKLDSMAASLIYSTYVGGGGDEIVSAIAVDASGQAHITGSTTSRDFATTAGAYRRSYSGPYSLPLIVDFLFGDAFYIKVAADGGSFVYSTYFGGVGDDIGTCISVDGNGSVYIGGVTASKDFPVTSDAIAGTYQGGPFDGFLWIFDSSGNRVSATYLGGSGNDLILSMAMDKNGSLYFAGATGSPNLPVTSDAAQRKFGGLTRDTKFKGDAFVMRIDAGASNPGSGSTTNGISSVANAASNIVGTVSAGMYFKASGLGLAAAAAGSTLSANGSLGTVSGSTRILFDSIPAPLISSSATSVIGYVPLSVQGKSTVQVVAEVAGKQLLPALTVQVADAVPGVFTLDGSGQGQVLALDDSGNLNGDGNPAGAGSTLTLYLTGGGLTIAPRMDGQLTYAAPATLALPTSATIGGTPAAVLRASTIPFQVDGLIEVVILVPDGVPSGPAPLYITVGTAQSQDGVTVAMP